MDLNLQDRVVLITGANRGIGRAIARAAVAEGAIAVVVGREAEACEQISSRNWGRKRSSWLTCDGPCG